MRWPQWLHQMLAMLGARAGKPAPIERQAVFDETLEQLDNTPTPRLCQVCMHTRSQCRCAFFAVLPIGSEFDLDAHTPSSAQTLPDAGNPPSSHPPGKRKPQ